MFILLKSDRNYYNLMETTDDGKKILQFRKQPVGSGSIKELLQDVAFEPIRPSQYHNPENYYQQIGNNEKPGPISNRSIYPIAYFDKVPTYEEIERDYPELLI